MAKKDENGIPQSLPRGVVRVVKANAVNLAQQAKRKLKKSEQ